MADLVPLACVGRPHGYRGAFIAQKHTGQESALGHVRKVWVGPSPEEASPVEVRKASWMPKGWRVELEGWDSDELPKAHRFQWLYVPREQLPPTDEDEFYLADLEGCLAVRAEDGEVLGRFTQLEPARDVGPDRWWFDFNGAAVPVPAVPEFIQEVDLKNRRIVLSGIEAFR